MNSELITNWSEHDNWLRKVLMLASKTLRIFDADLSKLKFERSENAETLRAFLSADRRHSLRIIVRNAEPLRRNSPRMMKLLAAYPENLLIFECSRHLASLNDSMMIADDKHALIRFHQDNVRSKIIVDSLEDCSPYAHRFEEIARECSEQISTTILGL